jgi:glycosyltransferase involved in cell wall biosynthesis
MPIERAPLSERATKTPSIVGIANDDPFAPGTFSGCSLPLFRAFQRDGTLLTAVSSRPSVLATRLNQLATFSPDRNRWMYKFYSSAGFRDANNQAARDRIARLDQSAFDTVLQLSALFDATAVPGKMTVSYHDTHFLEHARNRLPSMQLSRRAADAIVAHERGIYERSSMLFTMSRWAADSFMRTYGLPATKVEPVGAGSNLPFADPSLKRAGDDPEILFVGFDFVRKGGPTLLAAFERVRRAIPEAKLTIVGPRSIGAVPPGVRFLGRIPRTDADGPDSLAAVYRQAAVFAMPSVLEPFGFVFLEAMSQKLPCIGTDAFAMPEIIEHGATGYVVPIGDAHALAVRLIELLADPQAARQMGERGYARARERYTWDGTASRISARAGDLL